MSEEYQVTMSYNNETTVTLESATNNQVATSYNVAQSIEDLGNVDTSALDKTGSTTNNYVMVYDATAQGYKFVNPDAVLYANLFGNLVDYENIKEFCNLRKIPLIEDAAQSMGAIYKKIPSGKLGDISIFSFDPMKNLPSFGTGGMVLTDSDKHYKNIISLRRHGFGMKYEYGYNSLISEDHCNQLLFLFGKFKSLQKKRKQIASWYFELLPDLNFIRQEETTGIFHKTTISSYHKLVLLADKRRDLQKQLESHGIETKIHYKRTLDSNNFGRYPNAERLCSNAISLPIYPFLKEEEVEYICKTIKLFYGV